MARGCKFGGCGSAGWLRCVWRGGVGVVLLAVLLVAPPPAHASTLRLCPLQGARVTVTDLHTYLFSTTARHLQVTVSAPLCEIEARLNWSAPEVGGRPWYVFGVRVNDSQVTASVGEDDNEVSVSFLQAWDQVAVCTSVGIEFLFPATTRLAMDCTAGDVRPRHHDGQWRPDHYPNTILVDLYDLDHRLPRDHGGSYQILFIPLAAIGFVVTVCLRYCLCPKHATTSAPVTLARVRRQLSRSSVGAASTIRSEQDLPPSYAELHNEESPPPYSEVEKARDLTLDTAKMDTATITPGETTSTSPVHPPPVA